MRRCPSCKLAMRVNDPGYGVQSLPGSVYVGMGWPEGGYDVCWDCWHKQHPETPPLSAPRFRDHPSDNWICTICNRYAREDDQCISMTGRLRLETADILTFSKRPLTADEAAVIRANARRKCPDRVVATMLKRLFGLTPGVKMCCQECWYILAPVVLARLKREKAIRPDLTIGSVGYVLV